MGAPPEVDALIDSYALYLILIWLVVDIIVCIKSSKKRALHDIIAGTVVVRLNVSEEEDAGKKLQPPGPEEYADVLT